MDYVTLVRRRERYGQVTHCHVPVYAHWGMGLTLPPLFVAIVFDSDLRAV